MGKKRRRFLIGEVALLVGLVVVLIGVVRPVLRPRGRAEKRWSYAMLKCQMVALDRYRAELGAYPPGDITLVGGSAEYGSSEALVHYLGQVRRKQGRALGPYMTFKEDRLTDSDDDGFPEYRDPWAGPWLYARRTPAPNVADGETPPRLYDIASPGPDGKLGGRMVPGKGYVPATTPEGEAAEADNVTNWR